MADSLQQSAEGAVLADEPDFEPVGRERACYPAAIGRGLYGKIRRKKRRGYRVAGVVAGRGSAPRPNLVQHHLWRNAEPIVNLAGVQKEKQYVHIDGRGARTRSCDD